MNALGHSPSPYGIPRPRMAKFGQIVTKRLLTDYRPLITIQKEKNNGKSIGPQMP